MKKLAGKLAQQIETEWISFFPSLTKYKPLHLLKRAGPLLLGVYLEPTRERDAYTPIAHMHNLGIPFPIISLHLASHGRLINLREHAGDAVGVARSLCLDNPFLENGPIAASMIITRHRQVALDRKYPVFRAYVSTYDSLLTLMLVLGKLDLAARVADYVFSRLDDDELLPGGVSATSFREKTIAKLSNPAQVAEIVDSEITKHRVGKVSCVDLVDDVRAEQLWF